MILHPGESTVRIALLAFALSLTTSGLRAQDAAPADTFAIDWSMNLLGLRVEHQLPIGVTFVADCPPGGSVGGTIWGTDTYTSDSPICMAAAHAGALTAAGGGVVIVEVAPGLQEYVGSIRNGVASSSYPSWDTSYRFPGAPASGTMGADTTPGARVMHEYQGDWHTTANRVGAPAGALVEFECSAGGTGGNVWGTDIYTDDSSICEAAVHAGMIKRADGGVVHFEQLGPQPSFQASERNGVVTMRYPAWPGSFRFVTIEE
jgi:hypothetical protein